MQNPVRSYRPQRVAAGLAISGVFELGPLRDTYLDEKLRLTDDEIAALSPLRQPAVQKTLAITYGTAELPPLVSDSRDLHALRATVHAPGVLIPVVGLSSVPPTWAWCRASCVP